RRRDGIRTARQCRRAGHGAHRARPVRRQRRMRGFETVYAFAVSLGIGLVLGLERERRPQTKAGMRTFALTALLGTASALLAEQAAASWLLPAGLFACALMMIAAD